jgi:hypothetical protein
MSRSAYMEWVDVEATAKEMAGNWREFESFCWHRSYDIEDAENWAIIYSSNRDSGLLAQSNESAINQMLDKFTEGDDPDLVFESHSHWACGHVDGFSVRVYGTDGTISDAFRELCRIQTALEDYPVLDEDDYSERELEATLANYTSEIGHYRSDLPEGWEFEVYRHFSDTNQYRYVENRDDQGGWAPREVLVKALIEMGMLEQEEE